MQQFGESNWLTRGLRGFTACGKSLSWNGTASQTAEKLSLEGHGFSRATIMIKNSWALAPEVRFFTILLRDPLEKAYLNG
jgi:hypothetical protein